MATRGSPRPHGLDPGKFERTLLFYRPSHRPEMFLASHSDGGRSPLNPYEWLCICPQEVWMDNIHVEVIADDTSLGIDQLPVKPIYPNGGGLVEYGLSRCAKRDRYRAGIAVFWYLAKCLYNGGLDRKTVEDHLRREKDIAHNSAERERANPAILAGFFG